MYALNPLPVIIDCSWAWSQQYDGSWPALLVIILRGWRWLCSTHSLPECIVCGEPSNHIGDTEDYTQETLS